MFLFLEMTPYDLLVARGGLLSQEHNKLKGNVIMSLCPCAMYAWVQALPGPHFHNVTVIVCEVGLVPESSKKRPVLSETSRYLVSLHCIRQRDRRRVSTEKERSVFLIIKSEQVTLYCQVFHFNCL